MTTFFFKIINFIYLFFIFFIFKIETQSKSIYKNNKYNKKIQSFKGNKTKKKEEENKYIKIEEKMVNFSVRKGEKIGKFLSSLFYRNKEKFVCNLDDKMIFKQDISMGRVNYSTICSYLSREYDIVVKRDPNTQIIGISHDTNYWYWKFYNVPFSNYSYNITNNMNYGHREIRNTSADMSFKNDKNQDTFANNQPIKNFHCSRGVNSLSYSIFHTIDPWQELDQNISQITSNYFINKNSGIIGIHGNDQQHRLMKNLIDIINKQNSYFFVIVVKIWKVKYNRRNSNNNVFIHDGLIEKIGENLSKIERDAGTKAVSISVAKTMKSFMKRNMIDDIKMDSTHKIITMNNRSILYMDTREIMHTSNKNFVEYFNQSRIETSYKGYDKSTEGTSFYLHPLLLDEDTAMMYFVPIIIEREKNEIYENKSLSSHFVIKNKESVALGGFNKNKIVNITERIPLFSKIPIIGYFFRRKKIIQYRESIIITINIEIKKIDIENTIYKEES